MLPLIRLRRSGVGCPPASLRLRPDPRVEVQLVQDARDECDVAGPAAEDLWIEGVDVVDAEEVGRQG